MNYKLNWATSTPEQAKRLVKTLGAKSLDCIKAYDEDDKLIDNYTSMVCFDYIEADKKTCQWINRIYKGGASWLKFIRN